jgi:hypothetical protein
MMGKQNPVGWRLGQARNGPSLFPVGEDQENGLARRRGDAENTFAMPRIWEAVLESGIFRCVNGLKEENLSSRREDDESL